MNIIVNGDPREVSADATVAELVVVLTPAEGGVAVAVNGEVVTRSAWTATELRPGDRMEVLTAVQGG